MNSLIKFKIFLFLPLILAASGCISTSPIPGYARSGDQLQIGLGGIKRNSTGGTLLPTDIVAIITDADSVSHNVMVTGLFRAYPDHTSWYARDSLDRADIFFGNVEPYDGMWWATVRLADPVGAVPLPLAVGPARIAIFSAKLINTGWVEEGNLSNFPIEILAGTTSVSQEESKQFLAYKYRESLTINPDTLSGITEIGGFQVKVTYNTSAVFQPPSIPSVFPRVVPYSHDPNINIIQQTVDNGDGTETLTAMITNPHGFVPNADLGGSWAIGKSTFADLEFAVIVTDTSDLADGWESNYWIDATGSYYVDINGDVLTSVSPVLGRSF